MDDNMVSPKLVEADVWLLNISGKEEALEAGTSSAPFREALFTEVHTKGDEERTQNSRTKKIPLFPFPTAC